MNNMEEIVKHINDTNASYRTPNAGDAKNTDLFLDNEHYELFRDAGEQITVRYNKENLQKAILFIASILPRKYDNSSIHRTEPFSSAFVFDQLALLDAFFTIDGIKVESRTQTWNPRKDVMKKNGEIDNRFYFNGLLEDVSYINNKGEHKTTKFTIRNYLAGGYSDLHIKKADNGIFDVWVTNTFEYKNDGKDSRYEEVDKVHVSYLPQKSLYKLFVFAIKSKPFLLLAGISGTGKSRIVREFAFKSCPKYLQDKDGTTPGNYCMIEVKPNWHDSTELLGYYSRLGNKPGYQFTKFVKFLVKAKMFPTVPFFVCLDEMNLAPVEQYFAEILSILETRKHPKNDKTGEVDMTTVKTEPIIDAQYFRELSEMPHTKNAQTGEPFCSNLTDRDIYLRLFGLDTENDIDEEVGNRTDLITEGLTLPDNVVIIGTVNMDDTTHQFSRKVIDRAMTIEMNGGNLRNMFGGSKNLDYLPEEEQEKWQNAFTCQYVTADEVLEAHSDVADELMDKLPSKLEQINLALKGTPFEVSYRVLNELTIMVGVMLDEGMELDDAIAQSVNNILLMKILPRIEGDAEMFALSREYKTKVDVSYENRLEWLKDIAPDIKEPSADADSENDDSEEKTEIVKEHQQTAKEKIQEMIDRLNNQEFTRFWP
jgi:hypothetical protein